MATSPRAISKTVLDREADARFWAQTGYKVGRKLDPGDPTDKAMIPVWLDIYAKIKREDAAGSLVLTYNHPDVERHLDDAALAGHAAAAHLDAAIDELDPDFARHHVNAAASAATKANAATRGAAARQPPTVSPIIVEAAARESARAANAPPPAPAVVDLPAGHPAASSDAARPVLPPEVVTTPPAAAARPPVRPRPRSPGGLGHHFAAAQAIAAPSVAIETHEDAAARPTAPIGTLHPRTTAEIRQVAAALARRAAGRFVGVNYDPAEQWSVPMFGSLQEGAAWYGQLANTPDMFRYIAFFDKGDGRTALVPIGEVFGSSQAIGALGEATRVAPRSPTRDEETETGTSSKAKAGYGIAAVGAVAVAGILTIFATGRRRSRAGGSFP